MKNITDPSKYTHEQLVEIGLCRSATIDVTPYIDESFSPDQIDQVCRGLLVGVDVRLYANSTFSPDHMSVLRNDLVRGLDISNYNDPRYNYQQMMTIRNAVIVDGLYSKLFADPKLTSDQMHEIITRLRQVSSTVKSFPKVTGRSKTERDGK